MLFFKSELVEIYSVNAKYNLYLFHGIIYIKLLFHLLYSILHDFPVYSYFFVHFMVLYMPKSNSKFSGLRITNLLPKTIW